MDKENGSGTRRTGVYQYGSPWSTSFVSTLEEDV